MTKRNYTPTNSISNTSNMDWLNKEILNRINDNMPGNGKSRQKIFRHKTALWLDKTFFEILDCCNVRTLFECGAREASASKLFVEKMGGKAIAIEANPYTYKSMTLKSEAFGVKTLNIGLGEKAGNFDLNIPLESETKGSASFLRKPDKQYRCVNVPVETLDNIGKKYLRPRTNYALWVDVEGMALEVLKGGANLLDDSRCSAVKVEVEERMFWMNQKTAGDVNKFLTQFGFIPVSRDIEYEQQYNVIYLKQELVELCAPTLSKSLEALSKIKLNLFEILFPKFQKILK